MKSFASLLALALFASSALGYGRGMQKKHVRNQESAPPLVAPASANVTARANSGKRGLSFNDAGLTKNFNSGYARICVGAM